MSNLIKDKSFRFAIKIIEIYRLLTHVKKEFVLSKQLMRSGTSIGANVRESQNAESKADFIHKLSIAQKEADETLYWLEILKAGNYLQDNEYDSMHNEANELLRMIRAIILTSKKSLNKQV
jgi:four helix bundle protein